MRVALYWAPDPEDPLAAAGNAWLGRNAELGAPVPAPLLPGLAEIAEAPRGYGFHATLRPPMRLATGWEEFMADSGLIAASIAGFPMPELCVTDMDGFLALGIAAPCAALHRLADACVAGTDRHRLRPDAAELSRRRKAGLSPLQEALLQRWGYPYVMKGWRFHMTLSRRLTAPEMAVWHPAAEAHFAAALAMPRRCSAVSVFTQKGAGAFLIAERLQLR